MSTNLTKRTLSREYAFKFLYKHLLPDFVNEKNEFKNNRDSLNKALLEFDHSFSEKDEEHPNNFLDGKDKKFAHELIMGALRFEDEAYQKIIPLLTNKNLDKVERMNLAVLILGYFEIKTDELNSPGIYINEYVNITKKYCPNDSAGFINSVLDKIAKENA